MNVLAGVVIDDCLYLEVCKVPYLVYFFSCAKSILRNLVSRHFLFFISITTSSEFLEFEMILLKSWGLKIWQVANMQSSKILKNMF